VILLGSNSHSSVKSLVGSGYVGIPTLVAVVLGYAAQDYAS
jgi:hypothetical protein